MLSLAREDGSRGLVAKVELLLVEFGTVCDIHRGEIERIIPHGMQSPEGFLKGVVSYGRRVEAARGCFQYKLDELRREAAEGTNCSTSHDQHAPISRLGRVSFVEVDRFTQHEHQSKQWVGQTSTAPTMSVSISDEMYPLA
jgi:hypothetical protein